MTQRSARQAFVLGAVRVDPALRRLTGPAGSIQLEPKVLEVLLRLCESPGEVVSQEELLASVWEGNAVSDEVVRRAISELRKAFGDDARQPRVIETIPKGGYRLIAPVGSAAAGSAGAEPPTPSGAAAGPAADRDGGTGSTRGLAAWRSTGRPLAGRLAAAAAVAALAAVALLLARTSATDAGRAEASRPLSAMPFTTYPGEEFLPAFAPDGERVAFAWRREGEGTPDVYVKQLGSETPVRLTSGPEWDGFPAWSPDGREVAYLSAARRRVEVRIVSALGGTSRPVLGWEGRELTGLAWSPDGRHLAYGKPVGPDGLRAVFRLDLDTGAEVRLTAPPAGIHGDGRPAFSPDGGSVAFVRTTVHGIQDLYRVGTAGGEESRLSHLARKVTGFAWTPGGEAIVFASYSAGSHRLWRLGLAGGAPELLAGAGEHAMDVALAPTGGRMVYSRYLWDANVWSLDLPGEDLEPLVRSTEWDAAPDLSPDGARIVFASTRSGAAEIWAAGADGGSPVRLTSFGGPYTTHPRWSPDGRLIAFDSRAGGNADLYLVEERGGPPRRLTDAPSDEMLPTWSGDGRSLYLASNRGGDWQVWTMPAGGGEARQLSRGGGFFAVEAPDGGGVYFARHVGAGLWRVPVEGGEETPVLPALEDGQWGEWWPAAGGIYYVARAPDGRPTLTFHDLATGESRTLAPLDRWPESPGLSVARDGRRVLFAQVDRVESDLMLVEP